MSKIYDIVENGIIPVNLYGDFIIETSIIELDYPRCFIASNKGKYYAFLEIENSNDKYGWDVSEVSLEDINNVNTGLNNVQSLFINKNLFLLLFNNSNVGSLTPVSSFEEKYSIKGDIYRKNFCDMDTLFDYHNFAAISKDENSNKVSIVLQNNKGCLTEVMIKLINYLNSIFKNLKNPLNIMNSELSVMKASTVVTFTFNDKDGTLFNDDNRLTPSSSKGIAEFANILSSTNPASLLDNQDKKTEIALKKYGNLIKTFDKTNDVCPKIVVSTPEKSKPVSYDMSKNATKEKKAAVYSALSYLKEKSHTKKEIITKKGILTGVITTNGNYFSFISNDQTKYSGIVDFSIIGVQEFDVKGSEYEATIENTKILSETGEQIRESNKLISLTFIKKIQRHKQLSINDNI